MPHEDSSTPAFDMSRRSRHLRDHPAGAAGQRRTSAAASPTTSSPATRARRCGRRAAIRYSTPAAGANVGAATPRRSTSSSGGTPTRSRELEDGTAITKYGGGTLQSCAECTSNNGTKSTPTLDGRPVRRLARRDRLARVEQLGAAPLHDHRPHGAPHLHADARPAVTGPSRRRRSQRISPATGARRSSGGSRTAPRCASTRPPT